MSHNSSYQQPSLWQRFRPHGKRSMVSKAFTAIELVVTVAALGLLASVTALAIGNVTKSAQHSKITSDVHHLNSAIRIYVASGGSLSGVETNHQVIEKLKTSRSAANKATHTGAPSGRMIDSRVDLREVPSGSWKLRANFDVAQQRFELSNTGSGVEFVLNENLAEASTTLEERSNGIVQYSSNSTWIWDHSNRNNPSHAAGPTVFTTNPDVSDGIPIASGGGDDDEGGTPPGGGGTGPGNPGSGSTNPPKPPAPGRFPTPVLNYNNGIFRQSEFPLMVQILNLPNVAHVQPQYRVTASGSTSYGSWTNYTGPVPRPKNSRIQVRYISLDTSKNLDSTARTAYYRPLIEDFTGNVTGEFHSPVGGDRLVYHISETKDFFSHGDPVYMMGSDPVDTGAPSSLLYQANSFTEVQPGQKFKLGDLTYHNGNSYYESHADTVKLEVEIDLPNISQVVRFDLFFELINTTNDPDDAAASADIVRLTNLSQNLGLTIDGTSYRVQLEFGAMDSFGFGSASQFHVYEGATGKGEINATFIAQ